MNRFTILQFGATGQVARELLMCAPYAGARIQSLSRHDCDLTDEASVRRAVLDASEDTDVVVNAAAYTAVDRAEDDREAAIAINERAPGVMAHACRERALPLIHLSTDYVFSGEKPASYGEDDPVEPIGVYGHSKLAGERAVSLAHPGAVILRTSWVFSPWGQNFLRTMVRLAGEREELGIVDDQHGCPTPAADLAEAVLAIALKLARGQDGYGGIYHFSGGEPTTWRRFADAIFAEMSALGMKTPKVNPVTTREYPTPAARPAHSVLNCRKIGRVFNIQPADWRAGLRRDLRKIVQDGSQSV